MQSKAIIKTKEVKRPYSQETLGFRLQAAVPNQAGGKFDKDGVSFRKPYLIGESSDHTLLSKQEVMKFIKHLQDMNYTEFEFLVD